MDFKNRKALHNYETKESYSAGMVLPGWVVKAIRSGKVDLKDAYVQFGREGKLAVVKNFRATPGAATPQSYIAGGDEYRLLLTKSEMHRLWVKQQEGGVAFPVLGLTQKNGRFKLEFALAVGRKAFDKRRFEKKREWERRTKE